MSLFDILLAVALFGVAVYLYFYSQRQEERFADEPFAKEPKRFSRYSVPNSEEEEELELDSQSRDLDELLMPLAEPCLLLRRTNKETATYLGGEPPAYPGFVWPRHRGQLLEFIASVDLANLGGNLDWLPKEGRLLFFYNRDTDATDSFAVLLTPVLGLEVPSVPEPEGLPDITPLLKQFFTCVPELLPPSPTDESIAPLQLTRQERDEAYACHEGLYGGHPHHQVGGCCDPVQDSDMRVRCELISRGLPLNGEPLDQTLEAEVHEAAKSWKLLLQLDTDESLRMEWGDMGRLYFWVREQDARRGDFSKVQADMQFH